jgi:hypothetical protein
MPMFFYTYYSYEPYGRGYIGSRGSSVEPSVDFYMGSYTDETFNPTEKIIISIHETREDAHLAEIKLHEFFCRLRDLSTYINTSKKYLNDRRRGDGYKVFLEDINKNPSILDIPIRKLGKMYGTSHTSISRWKKSRSFIRYFRIANANAD